MKFKLRPFRCQTLTIDLSHHDVHISKKISFCKKKKSNYKKNKIGTGFYFVLIGV